MSFQAKENRPGANGADSKNLICDNTSLAPDHDGLVAGLYVAVVQLRGDHVPARYRKRVYLSLAGAQRAIDRARQDGLDASIVLCRLTPVSGEQV